MKLYSGPLSLFSRKVEVALHEKGLPFERVFVPFSQAKGYSPKHPDVAAANPKAQVPVLVDGDLTLFDSTVILERPKLKDYRTAIREELSAALGLTLDRVSVKFKTAEKVGQVGEGKSAEAQDRLPAPERRNTRSVRSR